MPQYGSVVHIGGFRSEPTGNKECLEAVWTQGDSCRTCSVLCYRSGWTKQHSTMDNKLRVST